MPEPDTGRRGWRMIELVNKFEKGVYAVLMALLMLVLVGSLIDLVWP